MTSPHPPELQDAATDAQPTRYMRAPHVAWRRIGEETVVLDLKEHRLVALNPVGGRLWHHLDAPRGVEQLGGPAGIGAFLEELAEMGLLERTECGPSPANDDSADGGAEPDGVPAILWQEPIQNAAQTGTGCAFISGQNAICNSVPFS